MTDDRLLLREILADLKDIRSDLRRIDARMDREFSELHDRLRRLDERIDGFSARIGRLEDVR
jgi:hypothetical protein